MGELSKKMLTTGSATTQTIDKLFKKGYVSRNSDKNDRRTVFIKLKAKGKKVYRSYYHCKSDLISDICVNVDSNKKEFVRVTIKKIINGRRKNLERNMRKT